MHKTAIPQKARVVLAPLRDSSEPRSSSSDLWLADGYDFSLFGWLILLVIPQGPGEERGTVLESSQVPCQDDIGGGLTFQSNRAPAW